MGHQKVLLVFASACVRDGAGRLLWQRRADFGWWGLPGGVLELDESLPECVVREVREETGLGVAPLRLIGVYSSPDYDVSYPNGDQVQQVTFCFECRVVGGDLGGDPGETLDLSWFASHESPPTAPWYQAMVDDLFQGRRDASFRRGNPGARRDDLPFFQRIRRHVGRAAYVSPGAAALIQDDAGRVLLIRRTDNGEWALPAGGMELGERIDQTVVNEVHEETGLRVEPVRLIGVYSDQLYWATYPNGDELKIVSALFKCQIVGGEMRPDGLESSDVRLFEPDELPPVSARYLYRLHDGLANRDEIEF